MYKKVGSFECNEKIDGSFESFHFFHFEPKYIENATNFVSSLETSISVKNVKFCFYALERAFLIDMKVEIKGLTLPELLILKHFLKHYDAYCPGWYDHAKMGELYFLLLFYFFVLRVTCDFVRFSWTFYGSLQRFSLFVVSQRRFPPLGLPQAQHRPSLRKLC